MCVSGSVHNEWVPIHFKVFFQDENLQWQQAIWSTGFLKCHCYTRIGGNNMKISVLQQVTDPKQFLQFQRLLQY